MNFNLPPKEPLMRTISMTADYDPYLLHSEPKVRYKFYELVLVPIGHAKYDESMWFLSKEYMNALKTDLKMLQALLKMIL
jgi:hypothetical protein